MTKNRALRFMSAVVLAGVATGCTTATQVPCSKVQSVFDKKNCPTPAQTPAATEKAKQQKSSIDASMRFHEDNSFVLSYGDYRAWSTLKTPSNTALAVSFDKVAYNIKDIRSIEIWESKQGRYSYDKLTIALNDGSSVEGYKSDMRLWLCERGKGCTSSVEGSKTSKYVSMATLGWQPNTDPATHYQDNGLSLISRMSRTERSSKLTVRADDDGIRQFRESLAKKEKVWADGAPARQAAAAAASRQSAEQHARAEAAFKSARFGTMTLCSANHVPFGMVDDNTTLTCPGFGSRSVGEMLSNGWTIVSMVANGGTNPNITFQKSQP